MSGCKEMTRRSNVSAVCNAEVSVAKVWAVGVGTVFDQKGVPMLQGLLLNQLTPEQMAQQLQTEVVNFLQQNGVQIPKS